MAKGEENAPSFLGGYGNERGHEAEGEGSAANVLGTICCGEVRGWQQPEGQILSSSNAP